MKQISLLFILACLLALPAFASRTEVSTATEIKSGTWVPGDTIVMRNGTWFNQSVKLKGEGTEDQPIVLMAETPGEVLMTGISTLSLSGKYLEAHGLYFSDGGLGSSPVIQFRTSTDEEAENCRVTNMVIDSYNPEDKTRDSKWVSLYGKNNRVDHCTFVNKTNSGTLLVVWLDHDVTVNHRIDQNFFGYRIANLDSNGKELNGQEIIRIGDSSTSMTTAGCVVSDNYFEYCNGEIEIISNKSCENVYRNNVFYQCVGMLTLRHGNRCTVDGNYFFGNGKANTGGVRVIGEDHKVHNNYFDNLRGSGWRAALCLVRGQEDSELNEYFQVKNAEVAFNTMVDCQQSFSVNYNSSSSRTMPPIGTTIAHNHVYNTNSGRNNVTISQTNVAELDVRWMNNLMNQGTYNGLSYDSTMILTGVEPSMLQAGTPIEVMEPEGSSALGDFSTSDYPEIVTDLRGRVRDTVKTPGASQLSGTVSREMPTRETAGANFFMAPTSVNSRTALHQDLDAYLSHGTIRLNVSEAGTLTVFDIRGRFLSREKLYQGENSTPVPAEGILLLNFRGDSGKLLTRKLACI